MCVCVVVLLWVSALLLPAHSSRHNTTLLYMCPHTTMYVSAYYYVSEYYYMCPHTTMCVSLYYYMCPHSFYQLIHQGILLCVSAYTKCVVILLHIRAHMCPHTTICVLILLYASLYSFVCVAILLNMCPAGTDTIPCEFIGFSENQMGACLFSFFFPPHHAATGTSKAHASADHSLKASALH